MVTNISSTLTYQLFPHWSLHIVRISVEDYDFDDVWIPMKNIGKMERTTITNEENLDTITPKTYLEFFELRLIVQNKNSKVNSKWK